MKNEKVYYCDSFGVTFLAMVSTVVSAVVPVSLSAVLAVVGSSATTESLPRFFASSFVVSASVPASVDFLFFDGETPVEL